MSKRLAWIVAFLGVTGLAIGMEVTAAIVGSEHMPTWTELIVGHVHWEVFAVAYGALVIWLGAHFGVRYWRKHQSQKEIK